MLDIVSESSRKKQETDRRKVAERELDNLNLKIDKLLLSLEDTKAVSRRRFRTEEECVICLTAAATMQTFPCGHKVVCRKCLIKTIQVAVSKRCLPLRCVVCRDRIIRLQNVSHYHLGSCSTTVVPSPSLPSTFIPTALHGTRPASSPVALAYAFHTNRPSSSPLSPTSPTNVFSLVSSSRYHSSFSRLLSPVGSGVNSLPRLPSSMSVPGNVPRMSHLIQSSLEDELLRCAPEDNRSLLPSHDEATTRVKRTTDFEDKIDPPVVNKTASTQSSRTAVPLELKCQTPNTHRAQAKLVNGANTPERSSSSTPPLNKVTTVHKNKSPCELDNKLIHKQNGQLQASNLRKVDTSCHNFKHSQSVKIHPTSNDHLSSFMDSASDLDPASTAQSSRVSNNSSQNPVSASKFLARLFTKTSRRKCNWFRTE